MAMGNGQIEKLARDIHSRGLLHPITVRPVTSDGSPHFEVVSGTRRLEAVRLLASRGAVDRRYSGPRSRNVRPRRFF